MSTFALVPAAGIGRRFGGAIPKQYLPLYGSTVMEHTLALLLGIDRIDRIVVAVHADDTHWRTLPVFGDTRIAVVTGGTERCDSVLAALQYIGREYSACEWVLVHDAARPCCPAADIDKLLSVLADHDVGGLLAVPVSDTLKRVDAMQQVLETVERAQLWQAQTPQLFRRKLLTDALEICRARGMIVTDEAQALECVGLVPAVVEGSRRNIKITRPEDLALAEHFLREQH